MKKHNVEHYTFNNQYNNTQCIIDELKELFQYYTIYIRAIYLTDNNPLTMHANETVETLHETLLEQFKLTPDTTYYDYSKKNITTLYNQQIINILIKNYQNYEINIIIDLFPKK